MLRRFLRAIGCLKSEQFLEDVDEVQLDSEVEGAGSAGYAENLKADLVDGVVGELLSDCDGKIYRDEVVETSCVDEAVLSRVGCSAWCIGYPGSQLEVCRICP